MAFSDGTVRDFSTDSRAVVTVLTVTLHAPHWPCVLVPGLLK